MSAAKSRGRGKGTGSGGGGGFDFAGCEEPVLPKPRHVTPEPERVTNILEDMPHLRFSDNDGIRLAARRKGWVPFINKKNGEQAFRIPEVPDSVVYASWDRGMQYLPRADDWLRERHKEVPEALDERLQTDWDELERQEREEAERKRAEEEARRRQAEEDEIERRRQEEEVERRRREAEEAEQKRKEAEEAERKRKEAEEEEQRRKEAEEEAQRMREAEEEERRRREAEEAERKRKEAEDEQRRREAEEEERKQREAEEAERQRREAEEAERRRNKEAARRKGAEEMDAMEAERQRMRELMRKRDEERAAQEAAAAKEEKERRAREAKRFLKKEHGKQAFAHLAHEGGLDRDVWDRPDDEAKRLGDFDPNHVASGGTATCVDAPTRAQAHVSRLERAVQQKLGGRASPLAPPGPSGSRPPGASSKSATRALSTGRTRRPDSAGAGDRVPSRAGEAGTLRRGGDDRPQQGSVPKLPPIVP